MRSVRFSNEGAIVQPKDKGENDEEDTHKKEIEMRLMTAIKSPVVSGRSFSLGKRPESHREALNMLESVLSDPAVAEGSVD